MRALRLPVSSRVLLALAGAGLACASPPPVPTAPRAFDEANREIAGVVLLETELDHVPATLGSAPIGTRGAGAPRTRCYRSSWRTDSTVLVLEADAIGDGTAITGFRILNSPSLAAHTQCVPSASVNADLATHGGLRLRLSRAEVEEQLGPSHENVESSWVMPWTVRKEKLAYRYGPGEAAGGASYAIDVWISNGAVVRIEVGRAFDE